MVQRVGVVGPIEELRRLVGSTIQWLILKPRVIEPMKAEALVVGGVPIERKGVFALILWVLRKGEPVAVTKRRCEIRHRPGVQNAEAIVADARCWNHVRASSSTRARRAIVW